MITFPSIDLKNVAVVYHWWVSLGLLIHPVEWSAVKEFILVYFFCSSSTVRLPETHQSHAKAHTQKEFINPPQQQQRINVAA